MAHCLRIHSRSLNESKRRATTMNTMLKSFVLLAATQLLCNGAFAACGGGGNHAKTPVDQAAAPAPATVLSVNAPQPVQVAVERHAMDTEATIAAGFDTSAFDA